MTPIPGSVLPPLPFLHLGSIAIPTYFFVNSLSTCICILWLMRRTSQLGLSQKSALDSCFFILIAGFIGARMAHVVFEEWAYYIEDPVRVFEFWRGGFVFYGGLVGGYLAGLFFYLKKETQILSWHDIFAPVVGLGYGLGRIGCFLEGCCYGKLCPFPWATEVHYQTGVHGVTTLLRHPTQLYGTFWEASAIVFLLFWEKRKSRPPGTLFFLWLGLHALGRILMEVFRADPRGPQWHHLSISMAFSFVLLGLSAIFLAGGGDKLRKISNFANFPHR